MDKSSILRALMDYKGCKTKREFAVLLGISEQNLSNWFNRNSIDYQKICETFPDIDANWLIMGEGEMLKQSPINIGDGDQLIGTKNTNNHNSDALITQFLNEIAAQRIMIEKLIQQNLEKDKLIAEQNKLIVELMSQK